MIPHISMQYLVFCIWISSLHIMSPRLIGLILVWLYSLSLFSLLFIFLTPTCSSSFSRLSTLREWLNLLTRIFSELAYILPFALTSNTNSNNVIKAKLKQAKKLKRDNFLFINEITVIFAIRIYTCHKLVLLLPKYYLFTKAAIHYIHLVHLKVVDQISSLLSCFVLSKSWQGFILSHNHKAMAELGQGLQYWNRCKR